MIEDILSPDEDKINEHKQNQLRELALINGTLREDEYCPVCGEKGHRQFECPHRAKAFKAAGVKCGICGDLSHPTRDCPMKQSGPTNEGILESEYDNFMAELSGGSSSSSSSSSSSHVASSTSTTTSSDGVITTSTTSTTNKTSGSGSSSTTKSSSGVTYVTPIVELVTKKPQTIIHVTSVMTGSSPPVFLSSMSYPPTSINGSNTNSNYGDSSTSHPSTMMMGISPLTSQYPTYNITPIPPPLPTLPYGSTTIPITSPSMNDYNTFYHSNPSYSQYPAPIIQPPPPLPVIAPPPLPLPPNYTQPSAQQGNNSNSSSTGGSGNMKFHYTYPS